MELKANKGKVIEWPQPFLLHHRLSRATSLDYTRNTILIKCSINGNNESQSNREQMKK